MGYARAKPRTLANANLIAIYARRHAPKTVWTGSVEAAFTFQFPWLKKHTVKDRSHGSILKDTMPDIDNLCKQMLDVLQ